MDKSAFIERVLLIMNEAQMADSQGNSFIGANSAQVDKYIEGSYENAWRILANLVPRQWLTMNKCTNTVQGYSKGTGHIILPDDYYMLGCFKLNGWKKAVYEASVEDERVASIQSNPYTRGSVLRPVCTISNVLTTTGSTTSIQRALNFYTSEAEDGSTPSVDIFLYVPCITPLTELSSDDELDLKTEIIEPMAYVTAGCVFTIFGQEQIGSGVSERGMLMVPGYKSVRGTNVTIKQ